MPMLYIEGTSPWLLVVSFSADYELSLPLRSREKKSLFDLQVTNIGKLDMEWRTSMGERGRLQTSALIRIVSFVLFILISRPSPLVFPYYSAIGIATL